MKRCPLEAKPKKIVQNQDVMAILSFGINMGESFLVVQIMQKRNVDIQGHGEGRILHNTRNATESLGD